MIFVDGMRNLCLCLAACINVHDYEKLRGELTHASQEMSYYKLRKLRSVILESLRARYPRSIKHNPRYGNLDRNFTEEELRRFYGFLPDFKYALLFRCQDATGLRIGEAVRLKIENLNYEKHEIIVLTEKARRIDPVYLPLDIFNALCQYIHQHEKEIALHSGYIFFPEAGAHSKNDYIQPSQARKIFRKAAKAAGIAQVYGYSNEGDNGREPRPLYRLTTHSHRHYAATTFYNACKDPVKTNRFLRHSKNNLKDTMRYIGSQSQDVAIISEAAFSPKRLLEVKPQPWEGI